MAALSDKAGLTKLLKYAEQIGIPFKPLTPDEVELIANEPFAYEPNTVIEDKAEGVSGYYCKYPTGWALVAIGPSLGSTDARPLREWLSIPKGEGWATRSEVRRAAVSVAVEVGEIVYHEDDNGIVRLAEVTEIDKKGHPTKVKLRKQVIDAADVEGVWEKRVGHEEAARYLYDEGRDRFVNVWTYKTQLGRRAGIIAKREAEAADKGRNKMDRERAKLRAVEEDFFAKIERNKAARLKQSSIPAESQQALEYDSKKNADCSDEITRRDDVRELIDTNRSV